MIKAVNEIVDLLLKVNGQGVVENFSRAMLGKGLQKNKKKHSV